MEKYDITKSLLDIFETVMAFYTSCEAESVDNCHTIAANGKKQIT